MHSAPAVSYPVGRSSFYAAFMLGLHGLSAGIWVAWGMVSDAFGLGHLAVLALWIISAAVAVWAWLRSPTGSLIWDGQHWIWASGELSRTVALSVTLDLQRLMLMQLRSSDAPPLWLWLERGAAPARWRPWRRAVFARQKQSQTRDADWVAP